jgi:membrane-associated protein
VQTLALGPEWLDPENMIRAFGGLAVLGICAVVFAESGLLVGFFLPGDSLLFTAGLLVKTGHIDFPIWLLCLLITLSAIAGDQVGYYIGKRAGPAIFRRPDSRLFKQEYVDKAYSFFDRYGPRTIVLARFVPIVRTFAPVVAGVGHMRYRTFVTYNVVGGVLWGTGVTLLGYALGNIEFIQHNIEYILIGIVAVSVLPIAFELLRARSRRRLPAYDEEHERERVARDAISGDGA